MTPTDAQRRQAADTIALCTHHVSSCDVAAACQLCIATTLAEAVQQVIVCDCHTWPTIQEMHDYVEALEARCQKRFEAGAQARREADATKADRCWDDDIARGPHDSNSCCGTHIGSAIRTAPLVTETPDA